LAVLDKYGIKPTLALDKAVADHYPFLIKEGQKRDAEFVAHGLSRRRIIHIGMSEDEERRDTRDSIEAVEKATRKRPVGWSGPDFQETPNTPNLLAAEGIRYVCDWGNDEQPYKMTPKTGELYSLGVHAYLDDNYIHLHGRRTINEVNLLWREWFDGLYADGATTGRLWCSICTPGSWVSRGESGISTKCSATSAPTPGCGRRPAARSSTGSRRSQARPA